MSVRIEEHTHLLQLRDELVLRQTDEQVHQLLDLIINLLVLPGFFEVALRLAADTDELQADYDLPSSNLGLRRSAVV